MCWTGDSFVNLKVADHLVEHMGRRRADPAVIEVDDAAVVVEASLDFAPVILIGGKVFGRLHVPASLLAPAALAKESARKAPTIPAPAIPDKNARRLAIVNPILSRGVQNMLRMSSI